MILINKKEVPIDELGKRLGIKIPLEKIKKKPLFEINPAYLYKDPANGPGAVKHRQAMEFPAVFYAKTPGGENVEVRYCTNRTPDPKTNGNTEKFAPRMVDFEGKAEFINDDVDKAVYFWLHFFSATSPLRDKSKPYEYELVDDEAKATSLIAHLTLRGRATTHAANLDGNEMIIIAKGMKIAGAATMEPLMIKAQLMQYASENPAEYLSKAQSTVNQVEGLIYDSMDKGIFVMEGAFNAKRWKWGMGVRKGELIVEISNNVPDEREALVTHISQNINDYLPTLINTAKTVNAKSNLENAVQDVDILKELFEKKHDSNNIKAPVVPPAANINTDDYKQNEQQHNPDDTGGDQDEPDDLDPFAHFLPLPKSYAETQAYIGKHIDKKTPALASDLWKRIEKGDVTEKNMEITLEALKALK